MKHPLPSIISPLPMSGVLFYQLRPLPLELNRPDLEPYRFQEAYLELWQNRQRVGLITPSQVVQRLEPFGEVAIQEFLQGRATIFLLRQP